MVDKFDIYGCQERTEDSASGYLHLSDFHPITWWSAVKASHIRYVIFLSQVCNFSQQDFDAWKKQIFFFFLLQH